MNYSIFGATLITLGTNLAPLHAGHVFFPAVELGSGIVPMP
mgnify:FL=1